MNLYKMNRALILRNGCDARRNRRGLRILARIAFANHELLLANSCLKAARNG